MSTWTVLKDLMKKKLPARKCFLCKKGKIDDDDKISDGHISFKDYSTYEKIWDKFDMKDMDDYHDHYLKFYLADVFEKFIDTCLKFYKLDPCHYFGFPRMTWDAC